MYVSNTVKIFFFQIINKILRPFSKMYLLLYTFLVIEIAQYSLDRAQGKYHFSTSTGIVKNRHF